MYKTETLISNQSCARGDDWFTDIQFYDENGPVDITDWTIWLTIKRSQEDEDSAAVYQQEVTSHLDATNGLSRVHITNALNLFRGSYYYDIQFKTDDAIPQVGTIMTGQFMFYTDITRSTT